MNSDRHLKQHPDPPPPVSAAMARLLSAAARHGFALPRCAACGHRFYPPQPWCPRCLSLEIDHPQDSGHATVLSMTRIHRAWDAAWDTRLPVRVACVRTDSGVCLFALAEADLPAGAPVTVRLRAHDGGERLFWIETRSPA